MKVTTYILFLSILLLGSCQRQSIKNDRIIGAEETILHYLVDPTFLKQRGDTSILYLNPKLGNVELRFKWVLEEFPKTDTIWVTKKSKNTRNALADLRVKRRKKYFKILKDKLPLKGYSRLLGAKKGKVIPYVHVYIYYYKKPYKNKYYYYVETKYWRFGVTPLIFMLDKNYELIDFEYLPIKRKIKRKKNGT